MRQNVVVFTGAGISRESGLSTYRDKDGIWSKYDPDIVATPQGFESDTALALQFYNELKIAVANAQPNRAHQTIALLEELHKVTIITQNIYDLHERAGSSDVIHIHGELTKVISSKNRLDKKCIRYLPLTTPIKFGDKAIDGSQMRPYVVMFGEYLSEMTKACELVRNADVFLVIGTSLTVFPANQLVRYAHKEIPRYIIDPGDLNIPEGYIRIKATATKGMELFFNEIQNGFKLFLS